MDFLADSDLFCIKVIRKSSLDFGTFGLGYKSLQHAVYCLLKFLKKFSSVIIQNMHIVDIPFISYTPDFVRVVFECPLSGLKY